MTRRRSLSRAMLLSVALLVASTLAVSSENSEMLTRSFYVPVSLEVCEHLNDAVLYRGEQPLRELPGTQIFQFTFFPSLGRMVPELEKVRVEGRNGDHAFRTELVVTPTSVYVASKKLDLDLDKQMNRLRSKLDARHETTTLKLRCGASCVRETRSSSR